MLEIEAALKITGSDGRTIDLVSHGSELRAEIGELTLRRPTLRLVSSGLQLARRLSRALERQRMRLVVTRAGQPIVELGAGVSGGFAARLLGISRVRRYRR